MLLIDHIGKHLAYMIELAFAIAFGIVDTVVYEPALVRVGMDIHARDHADAFDHGLGVATVLRSHQCDRERVGLVEYRVINEDVATRSRHDLPTDVFPDQSWGDTLAM